MSINVSLVSRYFISDTNSGNYVVRSIIQREILIFFRKTAAANSFDSMTTMFTSVPHLVCIVRPRQSDIITQFTAKCTYKSFYEEVSEVFSRN